MVDFYDESELQDSAFARVLVTGLPKSGKTVAVLSTAPTPIVVINCDKPGAPMAAKRHGATGLKICDVTNAASWRGAYQQAIKMAEAGECSSIVVDTITMLVNNIIAPEMARSNEGFAIWKETLNRTLAGLNALMESPAHIFLIAHYGMEDGQISLDGQLKQTVPALVHDRIHLDFNPKGKPPRTFLVGPTASGLAGGRHSDESKALPADIKAVLAEFGYTE